MRKKFARRMRQVMLAFAIVFCASLFFFFGEARMTERKVPKEWAVVALVDEAKITREEFNFRLSREFRAYGGELNISLYVPLKASALEGMIEEMLKLRAAKAMRVKIEKRDMRKALEECVDGEVEALKSRFVSERRFKRFVKHKYGNLQVLRRDIERRLRSDSEFMDAFKLWLLFRELEERVKSRVKVSEEELLSQYDMVKLRQIVIKTDKRREARKLAEELARRAKKGEDFLELARKYSEEERSAELEGDIGWVGRGEKPELFERLAFSLKKGQVGGPVKVGDAFYILKCEDRKRELPKDFEKKKREMLETMRTQRQMEAWFNFLESLRRQAKIQILDPELAAYKAFIEGNYKRAYELYKKALDTSRLVQEAGGDPFLRLGPLYHQIALVCERLEKRKEAVSWLRKAWTETEEPEVALKIGDLLKELGKKKEAIEAYKQAREYAYEDPSIHQRLKQAFESLGLKEEAQREQKWLDEYCNRGEG